LFEERRMRHVLTIFHHPRKRASEFVQFIIVGRTARSGAFGRRLFVFAEMLIG